MDLTNIQLLWFTYDMWSHKLVHASKTEE